MFSCRWRCYIKEAGKPGIGTPESMGHGWQPGLAFDCDYTHLLGSITDEAGEQHRAHIMGKSRRLTCMQDPVGARRLGCASRTRQVPLLSLAVLTWLEQVGFTPDRPKGWVGKWIAPNPA